MRGAIRVSAGIVLLLLLWPGAPMPQAASAPIVLDSHPRAMLPELAVDGEGAAHIAWVLLREQLRLHLGRQGDQLRAADTGGQQYLGGFVVDVPIEMGLTYKWGQKITIDNFDAPPDCDFNISSYKPAAFQIRVLHWQARPIAGQRIEFAEEAKGGLNTGRISVAGVTRGNVAGPAVKLRLKAKPKRLKPRAKKAKTKRGKARRR